MPGVRIRHATARSTMALVPIMSKPLFAKADDLCPGCRMMFARSVVHQFKTIHLWVDDTGACVVSEGVLADLRLAGLPNIEVQNEVPKPPDVSFGSGAQPRERQDQVARSIWIPTPMKESNG